LNCVVSRGSSLSNSIDLYLDVKSRHGTVTAADQDR